MLRVVGEFAKQRILSALADPYSRKILDAIIEENKSALELSKECGIPITTVYRRLEEMLQDGLIVAVKYCRQAGIIAFGSVSTNTTSALFSLAFLAGFLQQCTVGLLNNVANAIHPSA